MAEKNLKNIQDIYDYVERNTSRNSLQIAQHMGVAKTTSGHWVRLLCDLGHLVRISGTKSNQGAKPDSFVVGGAGRPTEVPPRKNSTYRPPELDVKRKIIKAKQIGMQADALALPREFFQKLAA